MSSSSSWSFIKTTTALRAFLQNKVNNLRTPAPLLKVSLSPRARSQREKSPLSTQSVKHQFYSLNTQGWFRVCEIVLTAKASRMQPNWYWGCKRRIYLRTYSCFMSDKHPNLNLLQLLSSVRSATHTFLFPVYGKVIKVMLE